MITLMMMMTMTMMVAIIIIITINHRMCRHHRRDLVLFLILFDFLELFEDRKLFFGLGKKRNGGPKPLLTQVMPDSLVDLAGLGTFPQFVLVK